MIELWPPIPYPEWKPTCDALRLWAQIIGKYRLAHTPWMNHSWHATLYVHPRGLSTGPVPDDGQAVTILLDLHDHVLSAESSNGQRGSFPLEPMSVSAFFSRMRDVIAGIGGQLAINGKPNEIETPVPFAADFAARPYDRPAVERYHRALVSIDQVLQTFRTGFLGKVSPSHLFWGSFDLAVTRFSGRQAPLHPGGVLNLPDAVSREAYSHEVSSAGVWPGGSGANEPMFYAYAYPASEAFKHSVVEPAEARFDATLGEFLLTYEAVRTSADPQATLMRFLQSTYAAAADTGSWDRDQLECSTGRPRIPRPVPAS